MIVPIGFLDTSALTAVLVAKHRAALAEQGVLLLRGPTTPDHGADCTHTDLPLLESWGSARSALIRLRNSVGAHLGKQATLGKAAVCLLRPGAWSDWRVDRDPYSDAYMRLRITLVPSEDHRVLSGAASVSPAVGHIVCSDHRRPHCEINLGTVPWIELVVDVRRGDAPDLPVDDPAGEFGEPEA